MLAETWIKGVTALINVGSAAGLGVKRNCRGEQGDGEVERHSVVINICHHQNMVSLALQPPQWRRWRRGSVLIKEGAAPAPALETWG